MNLLILPPAMCKVIGKIRFFNLVMATSLGEGKFCIQASSCTRHTT